MNKTFLLIVAAAIFCLSCAGKIPQAAGKIPQAIVTQRSDGSFRIEAPSNEVPNIINSLSDLPRECVGQAEKIIAAARPEQNMVDMRCLSTSFRLIIRPIPKNAKILIFNPTQDKGYRAKIWSSEGSVPFDKYMPPQSFYIIEAPEGEYNYHFEAGGQLKEDKFLLTWRSVKISLAPFPGQPIQKVDKVIKLGWD